MDNIWSGSQRFAALTNPTSLAVKKGMISCPFPIVVDGEWFRDVESAYQTIKRRSEYLSFDELKALMTSLIEIKLRTYPLLKSLIRQRGGVAWLESCCHKVTLRGSRWEGIGRESGFLECLIAAYER